MKRLIVVVGVTGRQGGSVAESLLVSNAWRVRGLSRDVSSTASKELAAKGIEMVQCDINSRDDCLKAFQNAYGVFAVTNYWDVSLKQNVEQEKQQGINMVEAAHENGCKHFIWSSLPDCRTISNGQLQMPHYMGKYEIEEYIRQKHGSFFDYTTFIYVGFYYQNFLTFFQPDVIDNNHIEFRYPLTDQAKLPLFDVKDTGNVVVRCFNEPEKWGQKQIVPVVARNLTMKDICQKISKITGKTVTYVQLTYDEYMREKNVTSETIDNMKWYNDYAQIEQRWAHTTAQIYPNMKTLEEWIVESKWMMN